MLGVTLFVRVVSVNTVLTQQLTSRSPLLCPGAWYELGLLIERWNLAQDTGQSSDALPLSVAEDFGASWYCTAVWSKPARSGGS